MVGRLAAASGKPVVARKVARTRPSVGKKGEAAVTGVRGARGAVRRVGATAGVVAMEPSRERTAAGEKRSWRGGVDGKRLVLFRVALRERSTTGTGPATEAVGCTGGVAWGAAGGAAVKAALKSAAEVAATTAVTASAVAAESGLESGPWPWPLRSLVQTALR